MHLQNEIKRQVYNEYLKKEQKYSNLFLNIEQ